MTIHDPETQPSPSMSFRPTGRTVQEYSEHEHWSNKQWAWELLRRSHSFQRWCLKIQNSDYSLNVRNLRACKEYGLLRFKGFWESFQGEGIREPRFATTEIQSWSRVTRTQENARNRYPRIPLRPGEVLIKFYVSATTRSTKAVVAQLIDAKRRLKRRERQWLKRQNMNRRPNKHNRTSLLTLLRVLDLYDLNKSWRANDKTQSLSVAELVKKYFPKLVASCYRDELRMGRKFEGKRKTANMYANDYYLDLAATPDSDD